jgi:puromycin-sensitive aminopeptidase
MKKAERLLETITPSHYQLEITPKFEDFSFTSSESITFKIKIASKVLKFHSTDLDIKSAEIGEQKAAVTYQPDDQTATFDFDTELAAGEHILELEYSGPLRDDMHGFYRSKYESGGQEQWLATTQFEPTAAREAIVCIDEPSAKATFDVALVIDKELTGISNTNVTNEEVKGDEKRLTFATTPKMSPYLLAFLVGKFERITTKSDAGIEVGVYTTPGKKDLGQFALETAARTIDFYQDYFGIAYPLPKLDMIAVPDFAAGAMENWGAVTYRETAILVDPKQTAQVNKQYVAMVVAHELAHMWFGNLVTMAWWTDLWLNEGFASWVEYLAVDYLFPEWQMWTQFVADDYSHARDLDALANTHPIEVEVQHPGEIDEIFDAISYQKGASVIRMLYHYIGEMAFKQGLHDYLEHFAFGNAVTADLWRFLEEAANKPVRRIMSAWTSKPGFPLVTLTPDGNASQERFFASANEAKPDKTVWPIPLAFTDSEHQTEPMLLEQASGPITVPLGQADWYKPNPGQTGFYIVNYQPDQIEHMSGPLLHGQLPAIDRLGMLLDIAALVGAGKLGSDQLLRVLANLQRETDYAVWNGMLDGVGNVMSIADGDLLDKLEHFTAWLVKPRATKLGWEPKADESYFDALLRPRLLGPAGKCGDAETIKEAQRRFAERGSSPIPGDLRGTVYQISARFGDEATYEQLLQMYKQTELQEEGRRILAALTSFKDQKLIMRTLDLALSQDVRSQDSVIVIMHATANRNGHELGWQFIQDNWPELVKRYGGGGHLLSYIPGAVGGAFNTHDKAAEVEDFFAKNPHPSIERSVKQATERINHKADWAERDGAKLSKFLDGFKY